MREIFFSGFKKIEKDILKDIEIYKMKNYDLVYYKKSIVAFVIENFRQLKQNFSVLKKFTTIWYIVKNKNDIIPRHRNKKVKRFIYGTPEILIVHKGETKLTLFKKGKILKTLVLKKGDLISLIDCEHSFIFKKKHNSL